MGYAKFFDKQPQMNLECTVIPQRPRPDYHPPMGPLVVVYEDEYVLVLDKPTGLLTVSGTSPGTHDCLESRAMAYNPEARLVHRLDWDTSGLIIFGLTAKARVHLGRQFEDRVVKKQYIARVWGHPAQQSGIVNQPLRCDWPNRPRQMIDHEKGREAITEWEVIAHTETTSDLLMKPKTGRSHQLRVHCQFLGHPILGDRMYAPDEAYKAHARMCLHATQVEFYHPVTREWLVLKSPCPF